MIFAELWPHGVRELRFMVIALIAFLLLGLVAVLCLFWRGDNTNRGD